VARDILPPNYASLALICRRIGLAGVLAPLLSLSALLGCVDDTVVGDVGPEVGEEAETGGSGETQDTGEEFDGRPALGIHITEVEANQGTAVLIGKNGEWVDGPGRNAYMIRDRDTLVRLQHVVDENWIPREIMGVLHIRDADGVELPTRTRTLFIEASSEPSKFATNFYFSVAAAEAQPGTSYWVELLEVSGAIDLSSLSEGVNVTPPNFRLIGYELTPLEMKIVLVPIEYTFINPPTLVEPTEADIQLFHDSVLETNPLQTVSLEVHEQPYVWTTQLTNLGSLLSPMRTVRNADAAGPNVYYHAIVDVRGPAVNMVAGIASLTGDTKSDGNNRVAATVWYKPNPDFPPHGSAGTFVHEIGHNEGLSHVYCPQASSPAAGPDPNYPHEGGKIGVYGFGIRSFKLYTPTGAHDYMTYCGNAWVSDWTWNKTYARIRTLTSWDYEGAPGASGPHQPHQPLLIGTLFPDGSEDWWVMMGPAPAAEQIGGEQRLAITSEGDHGIVVDEVYTQISTLSDDATQVLIAPLHVPINEVQGLSRRTWRGQDHPIELGSIRVDPQVAGLDWAP